MKVKGFTIIYNGEKDSDLFPKYYSFDRVKCKTVKTALKYLQSWKQQAKDEGYEFLCKYFFVKNSVFEIREILEDGSDGMIVYRGKMEDIKIV